MPFKVQEDSLGEETDILFNQLQSADRAGNPQRGGRPSPKSPPNMASIRISYSDGRRLHWLAYPIYSAERQAQAAHEAERQHKEQALY